MHSLAMCLAAGLVLSSALSMPAFAQAIAGAVVRGRITDSTGHAIPFARVTADGLGDRVADDSGRFLLAVPRPGVVRLDVRRVGFHPLAMRVRVARDTTLRLVMQQLPASLARVKIEAEAATLSLELGGFYQRLRDKERGANTGHFILPEEIERRRGSVTQLVTGIPGLRVERLKLPGQSSSEYFALFGNARKWGRGLCPMEVYVDRVRLAPVVGNLGRADPLPVDVNEVLTIREIAGIEVYTRSNAPPEFALLNGTCGVVVIWTR